MTRTSANALTLVCFLLATTSMLMAAESIPDRPSRAIRTTDLRLRTLLEEGVRQSSTLRSLVARLQASDVVVYLLCDGPSQRPADGRLTFVSTAGGFRYVVVRMTLVQRDRQIALMAHELQHAVEIANVPAIVDGPSLIREYKRLGYINHFSALPGISFDTKAAVRVGEQVLRELSQPESAY
jgi:hypothetical protein